MAGLGCSISHSSMDPHTQCFKGKFKGKCHIAFLSLLIKTWWIWFPFCESDVTNTILLHISHFIVKYPAKKYYDLPLPAMWMSILNDSFSPRFGKFNCKWCERSVLVKGLLNFLQWPPMLEIRKSRVIK